MLVKDYQYISTLNTGSTTFEYDLIKYFEIDTTKNLEDVRKELLERTLNKESVYDNKTLYNFKGFEWKCEQDIMDVSFDQWVRLETLLSEGDNVKNLHLLLPIYFRPVTKKRKLFKIVKEIEPFSMDTQEKYGELLKDLPVETANGLMVFFYQNVPRYMNYLKIVYLNMMKEEVTKLLTVTE